MYICFLHNLLNALVQIANKTGFPKKMLTVPMNGNGMQRSLAPIETGRCRPQSQFGVCTGNKEKNSASNGIRIPVALETGLSRLKLSLQETKCTENSFLAVLPHICSATS
jgi:hypothetical protein